MARLWDKVRGLFGYEPKRDISYQGPRPKPIGEFPSYQSARDILSRMQGPEYWRGRYLEEARPLRETALHELRTTGIPETERSLQMAGLDPYSTYYQDIKTQPYRDLPYQLGKTRMELGLQGLGVGRAEQAGQLAGYQSLLAPEMTQEQRQVGFEREDWATQQALSRARREANRLANARMLSFISQAAAQAATMGMGGGATGGVGGSVGGVSGMGTQFTRGFGRQAMKPWMRYS